MVGVYFCQPGLLTSRHTVGARNFQLDLWPSYTGSIANHEVFVLLVGFVVSLLVLNDERSQTNSRMRPDTAAFDVCQHLGSKYESSSRRRVCPNVAEVGARLRGEAAPPTRRRLGRRRSIV